MSSAAQTQQSPSSPANPNSLNATIGQSSFSKLCLRKLTWGWWHRWNYRRKKINMGKPKYQMDRENYWMIDFFIWVVSSFQPMKLNFQFYAENYNSDSSFRQMKLSITSMKGCTSFRTNCQHLIDIDMMIDHFSFSFPSSSSILSR